MNAAFRLGARCNLVAVTRCARQPANPFPPEKVLRLDFASISLRGAFE